MARTVGAYSSVTQAPRLQQVWQSMRIMRARFTTADLVSTGSASESAVHKYCRALSRAGFLRLVQARVSGRPGSRDVWALVRDTGPKAPIRREDGTGVFDPNTGVAWGTQGLPVANRNDLNAVAKALLAKLADPRHPRDLADTYQACNQGEAYE